MKKPSFGVKLKDFLTAHAWAVILVTAALVIGVLLRPTDEANAVFVPPTEKLSVHLIDVGQGDAILIRHGGEAMLIDAGEAAAGKTVVEYLRAQGIERLKFALATHTHTDHVGGMAEVLEAVPVDTFLINEIPENRRTAFDAYNRMKQVLSERKIQIQNVKFGDVYTIGEASLQIIGPIGEAVAENDWSAVCLLTMGSRRFLFMGDAEAEEETALCRSGQELSADVLKVGHHGSRNASTAAFLERVRPSVALISCGKNNENGHPHQQTLQRLKAYAASLYRTDRSGTVVVTTDGSDLTVYPPNTSDK